MISVAIAKPAVPKVFVISRETMLSDRQRAMVERFLKRHIRSQRRRDTFMVAMMSRLGPGRPGDHAVTSAVTWAALQIGIERRLLENAGLIGREPKDGHVRVRRKACLGDEE